MRVAALYDIHGNLPALEAVLREIAQSQVDQIVVGGDVVAGPMPAETLACLLSQPLPVHFLRGNADREVLAQMAGAGPGDVPDHVREIVDWVARTLSPEHARLIASWPTTLCITIPPIGDVLFCHATPRSDTEVFTRLTPEAQVQPAFAGLDTAMVVCGHTHMQFDRRIGGARAVNAGSVGMAYAAPGAYWLLLGPGLEFRRTPYDRDQAAARVRATSYPQAQDFADTNVLRPPTEADALTVFTPMEMGRDTAR